MNQAVVEIKYPYQIEEIARITKVPEKLVKQYFDTYYEGDLNEYNVHKAIIELSGAITAKRFALKIGANPATILYRLKKLDVDVVVLDTGNVKSFLLPVRTQKVLYNIIRPRRCRKSSS